MNFLLAAPRLLHEIKNLNFFYFTDTLERLCLEQFEHIISRICTTALLLETIQKIFKVSALESIYYDLLIRKNNIRGSQQTYSYHFFTGATWELQGTGCKSVKDCKTVVTVFWIHLYYQDVYQRWENWTLGWTFGCQELYAELICSNWLYQLFKKSRTSVAVWTVLQIWPWLY